VLKKNQVDLETGHQWVGTDLAKCHESVIHDCLVFVGEL
jgi:hypothetical protein